MPVSPLVALYKHKKYSIEYNKLKYRVILRKGNEWISLPIQGFRLLVNSLEHGYIKGKDHANFVFNQLYGKIEIWRLEGAYTITIRSEGKSVYASQIIFTKLEMRDLYDTRDSVLAILDHHSPQFINPYISSSNDPNYKLDDTKEVELDTTEVLIERGEEYLNNGKKTGSLQKQPSLQIIHQAMASKPVTTDCEKTHQIGVVKPVTPGDKKRCFAAPDATPRKRSKNNNSSVPTNIPATEVSSTIEEDTVKQ